MAIPAFDTHAYVKRLKAAGFNEEQAEAQADLQAQVLSSLVTEKLATKEDILTIKNDVANLKNELITDILRAENQTKQEFIRITGRFNQLNWMIGFLLTGVATILFKLFLHS
jgi:hypothetical protein